MNTFSPTEAIKFGWNTFKANPGFLIGVLVIVFVTQLAVSLIVNSVPTDSSSVTVVSFFLSLITNLTLIVISLGLINSMLKLVNTGKGNFSDVFSEFTNFNLLVNYIVGSIIVALIVIGGLILLIVPGIYLAIRLSQFPFLIVDKNLGAIEAIKGSWNMTKGNVINLIIFEFFCLVVVNVGLFALFVGLLVAVPVTIVAAIYVYKMLSQQQIAPVAPMSQTPPPAMPAI